MAELDDRFVKRGYWVDWSKGPIMGQTFTVDAQTGTLVVAILTILASIATAQLWNLVTFTIHQVRADGKPAEGLVWQQQVLLRTMPTPTAFLADSIKISWAWRRTVSHSMLRGLPVLALALLFAIGSIAGGISTAYAVDNSNIEVLVDSPHCGRINETKVMTTETGDVFGALGDAIQSYATNCYQNSSSLPAVCRNTFHRPNITFSAVPADCPWNETMCSGEGSAAVAMDSGLIDVRTHFGVNVAEKDAVRFRRRTVCNVLPRTGHIFKRDKEYLAARGNPAERWMLEYGSWKGVPAAKRPEVTFNINSVLVEHQMSYFVTAMMSYPTDGPNTGIAPLPSMNRTDADIVLIPVWANAVVYEEPISDPLFSAHRLEMRQTGTGEDNALYWSDHYAGVVGCALQYQFCYPRPGQPDFCTPLGPSPPSTTPTTAYPSTTPIQASLLQLLQSLIRVASPNRGPQLGNLVAAKKLQIGIVTSLSPTQWITEVLAWESFSYSAYQTLLSASIIGASVFDRTGGDTYTDAPASTGDSQLCQSLRMRKAGGFANVNVFALVFVTTFSVVLSLLGTFVLKFCIFLARWRRALAPRVERWVADGVWQVQRRAFEAQEEGAWRGVGEEVPVTEEREMLRGWGGEDRWVGKKISCGSLGEEGREKEGDGKKGGDEEEVEWKRFRVSVGRVDTGATLVDGGDGDGKKKVGGLGKGKS